MLRLVKKKPRYIIECVLCSLVYFFVSPFSSLTLLEGIRHVKNLTPAISRDSSFGDPA